MEEEEDFILAQEKGCIFYLVIYFFNDSDIRHFIFFFFSSRRRHTRFSRDWSSDVCSSDLSSMTWCIFRVIELGGRVQLPGTVMLMRRLSEITAGHRAGSPRSLMDLPARAWLQEIPLAVHRRRGKLPAPSSITAMRQVLLRFLWLLDLAYE